MSQYLDSLKIGDKVAMRGPKGSLEYLGQGKFTIKKSINGQKVATPYYKKNIGMRKELEQIDSSRLHLWYTLDKPPAGWKYSEGFINTEMCRTHLPPAGDDTMIFVCGPPPMIKYACEPAFKELGIKSDQWYSF